MATDESARHELSDQLTAAIGPRSTETLMSHLPPVVAAMVTLSGVEATTAAALL